MGTRRVVASVCALALAVPAVASARPGFDPPVKTTDHVVYGDTKYDLQNKHDRAPKGDTKNDVKPSYANKVGSLSAAQMAAAYGMYEPTVVASPSTDSSDDGTNGWRIAAMVEAGVFVAIALGSALLVARTHPRRRAAA